MRETREGRTRRAALAVLGATAVLISLSAPTDPDPRTGTEASAEAGTEAGAEAGTEAGADVVPAAESGPAFPAVNYAVAVDESASLADADMAAEKAAAARIALGDVSSSSQVTVFGFAAAEGPGQSAVDPVCPRTTLDAAGRETVGACVGELRKRKDGEGTGTDFPSAIRQGVHELTTGTDPSAPRVLFLLTDGIMEVGDSPKYGDPAHRKAEGERQLTLELANAAAQGVQIWPLGFGPKPDEAQLARIAAGGYQKGCVELPSARPRAEKVDGAADVGPTLERIFAAAHCMRHVEGPSARPPATLEIGISPLATVGSIVVDKGDPAVEITYVDPAGHEVPTSGTYRDSRFELAGGTGTVEALRIVDPLPGVWKVKAEAPEGHRSVPVGVSVLWQGELRGAISMDPPSPRAGDRVTVTMRLQTREGYQIKDPGDYEGLRVRSELTGDGFDALALHLTDDGGGKDAKASDGSFTGTAEIPASADGTLRVSATLTAAGLSADTRSEDGRVAPGELPVTTALDIPAAGTHPGGRVTGTLAFHNTSDAPHTLKLSVTDLRPGLLTVTPARLTLEPGESGTRVVTVEAAPADVFGDRLGDGDGVSLAGNVTVVDTTDDGRRLVRTALSVRVTPEPTVWDRYWWAFLGAAVLIALTIAAVLSWIRLRRIRRDPRGLVLRLLDEHDEPLPGEHVAGHGHKQWYEFGVAEAHLSPRIERRAHGPYAVQRNPNGGAVLRRRDGGRTPLSAAIPVQLTEGLSLALGEETRNTRKQPGGSTSAGADGQNGASAYDQTYL